MSTLRTLLLNISGILKRFRSHGQRPRSVTYEGPAAPGLEHGDIPADDPARRDRARRENEPDRRSGVGFGFGLAHQYRLPRSQWDRRSIRRHRSGVVGRLFHFRVVTAAIGAAVSILFLKKDPPG